ncbi:hypothetical protein PTT_11415 [Pyrenophora teres f. teres 0-1]|uniref:DDE-1 domain-containing protein n=1 Tax=Pyrenophora teres f. teres (strain 0-1) TaxID=861557 RepID=E3RRH9_PYRTT|nr:hypothetical protein PTT_11415 [Pyrenophora teres f. teres 0-1]
MGVIGLMKVVIGAERRTRPALVQLGDREWEADIPRNWKLSVSENGWTNNALGLEWLKHFDTHTKAG